MAANRNGVAPFIAFIPIGCGLVVIGLNDNPLFVLAGVLFIVAAIVGIVRRRKSETEPDEPGQDDSRSD